MRSKVFILCFAILPIFGQIIFGQDRGFVNVPVKQTNGRKQNEILYKNSFALLIGNSVYSEWNSLPGVGRDIPQIEAVLRDKHGFVVEKALNMSKDELLRRIDKFISDYGQDYENRLLIYYAGHGYTTVFPDNRVMGYLVMKDAPIVPPVEEALLKTPSNIGAFRRKAVSMDDIENLAKAITTRHALFVFDSCFSGTALYRDNSIEVPQEISSEELEEMRGFLTAGNEKQRVRDDSPFRRAFIKGLEGKGDTNGDGYILSSELGAYVKREVYLETRNTDTPQSPIFGKQTNFTRGDMVFINPNKNLPIAEKNSTITTNSVSDETAFWSLIQNGNDIKDFENYLRRIESGEFKGIYKSTAELKIAKLKNLKPSQKIINSLSDKDSDWLNLLIQGETDQVIQETTTYLSKNKNDAFALKMRLIAYSYRNGNNPAAFGDASSLNFSVKNPKTFEDYDSLCLAKTFSDQSRIRLNNMLDSSSQNTELSKEIKRICLQAISLNQNSPFAHINMAIINSAENNYQFALIDLNSAIQINPKIYWAYFERGEVFLRMGNLEDAITSYGKAIELNPNFARAYYSRGKTFQKKGANDLALSDYSQFLKLSAEGSDACRVFKNRAKIYEIMGQNEKMVADQKSAADLISLSRSNFCIGDF